MVSKGITECEKEGNWRKMAKDVDLFLKVRYELNYKLSLIT